MKINKIRIFILYFCRVVEFISENFAQQVGYITHCDKIRFCFELFSRIPGLVNTHLL